MDFNTLKIPAVILDPVDHPGDRIAEGFSQHRHTGLAYGRQAFLCPLTRTALPQLVHQNAMRQEDHVQVPGLAPAVPELTVAHAQMLLAVPMEALCASPAATINPQYPRNLPMGAIADENLFRLFAFMFIPEDNHPDLMVHVGDANAFGEVPLPQTVDHHRFTSFGVDLAGQFIGSDLLALENDLTVEFQVAYVGPVISVNMVEIFGAGEVTVEGEVTGDVSCYHPVNQPANVFIVIDKFDTFFLAMLTFDEPVELQRVVFAGGTDIIRAC